MRTTVIVVGMLVLTGATGAQEIVPGAAPGAVPDAPGGAGAAPTAGEEAGTPGTEAPEERAQAEVDVRALQERIRSLQQELAALREQTRTQAQQLAALGQAIEQDRARQQAAESSREARIALASETIEILTRVHQVLDTGEDDVEDGLEGARVRLAAIAEEAALHGGEAEVHEAVEGQWAVAQIQSALDRRDFQDAKYQVRIALYRAQQARTIAASSAHPLGRQ